MACGDHNVMLFSELAGSDTPEDAADSTTARSLLEDNESGK